MPTWSSVQNRENFLKTLLPPLSPTLSPHKRLPVCKGEPWRTRAGQGMGPSSPPRRDGPTFEALPPPSAALHLKKPSQNRPPAGPWGSSAGRGRQMRGGGRGLDCGSITVMHGRACHRETQIICFTLAPRLGGEVVLPVPW